jgi:hypothetical protein
MAVDPANPLIVQSDKTLLLDVHAPRAEDARVAILPFAELEKSPEHIHTFRITPLSLWNAASAGLSPADIATALESYTRYPIPSGIIEGFSDTMSRYGKIRLLSLEQLAAACNGGGAAGADVSVSADADAGADAGTGRVDSDSARRVPLLVKIAPDLADEDVDAIADLALDLGLDGVVAVNTTIRHALGEGGLSGPPLLARGLEVVARLRARLGTGPVIIGVGGISSPEDAGAYLAAGADLVQAYTAFIYEGPAFPGRVNRALTS